MSHTSGLFKEVAIEAAIQSGRYIKRSLGTLLSISHKGIGDIVTNVDNRSEEIIIGKISSRFPRHSILSEENGVVKGSSPYKWVVDPLDGTTNFAHGFPFFSVSIALERDREIVLGVVFDPVRGELFFAEKGNGSFLNRRRIFVSKTETLEDALLATGFPYDVKKRLENVAHFRNFLLRACAVRRPGSASLDICYVACGRFDGFWEMYLKPWDSAAGSIILREAGGRTSAFDGKKYNIYEDNIIASNRHLHGKMLDVINVKI